MHGLKQLVYDDQPFFPSNQSEKTNQELYILWKQNKSDNIFLILYTLHSTHYKYSKIIFSDLTKGIVN